MSMQVTIPLGPDAEALLQQLRGLPDLLRKAIARGLDKGAALAVGDMTRKRFTGQGPFAVGEGRLGVKTSRLRSSLRWTKAAITGDVIGGAIGTNVRYAGAHEFGFKGPVQVRAHQRTISASQFTKAGTSVNLARIKGKAARQAALGKETVRAHSRVMNIPERAPIRKGIADNQQTFANEITAALRAAWESRN